jgi:hypothetical protein
MSDLVWPITEHARQRLAQRNLHAQDIEWVTRFGRIAYGNAATFYFLGKRDIPRGWERRLTRLVGTTLVIANGCLITAYRNRSGWKTIRRKGKWPSPATLRSRTLNPNRTSETA